MIQSYKINDFEGPLDLLIHLIKENKMDLLDFDIRIIIDQYLDAIRQAKTINLEIASEFLVMASTLVELKSRLLLPKPEIDLESDYVEVSEEELVKRLIEYKKYKEVSELLKDYQEERSLFFTKPIDDLSKYASEEETNLPSDVDLYDLVKSFNNMMKRLAKDKPGNSVIENNEMSMEKRSETLLEQIAYFDKDRILLEELIDYHTKSYLIVTFLALLDLAKKGKFKIGQDDAKENIYVYEVNLNG